MEKLVYKTSVTKGSKTTRITIKLADDCHNGHQDFSITADIFEGGRFAAGGCCHDGISRITEGDFDDFISLHLSDSNGIPLDAVANGFYHIKQEKLTPERFCECYRVTQAQYLKLAKAEDQDHYGILLEDLGIIQQWKAEAEKAIKRLESLTGETFTVNMTRNPYTPPTEAQRALYAQSKAQGHFTKREALKRARAKAKAEKAEKVKALWKFFAASMKNNSDTLKVKLVLVNRLGNDTPIYYNHTNTVAFNWCGRDKFTQEDLDTFLGKLTKTDYRNMPKGIKFVLNSR